MKKIFTILFAGMAFSASIMAVTTREVCGQFNGNLNIAGSLYPEKSIYLLPGTVDNAVTFVLPDFTYNAGKLGNIVLPNIPMDEAGMLHLENSTLWIDSISERAVITILNGLEDGGTVYNSIVTATDAMVLLSIAAPSLPEPILVLFVGKAVRDNNYILPNGGFEGEWTDAEPQGWHSFNSATGLMVDFIRNDYQFIQSDDVRPGTSGVHSAMMSSTMALGVKANGNCTNGQINAGSSTADDPAGNYNFSDPANAGFNTPFHGRPDSIVFWAKYLPADRDAANEVNKARLNAVITTDARYQDPEEADHYADIKIGAATINYAATGSMDWQRLAVPFEYYDANASKKPAFILATFSTNMQPGGGSSYTSGGTFDKVNVLDTVYLDDVQLIYNHSLQAFSKGGEVLSFDNGVASVADNYCDDCAKYAAVGNGITAQTFIAFDATHKCIFVYVIAEDYAQSGEYNLYRIDFADSDTTDINPQEGLDQIGSQHSEVSIQKVLRDGVLYIIRDNMWFTVSGTRVR